MRPYCEEEGQWPGCTVGSTSGYYNGSEMSRKKESQRVIGMQLTEVEETDSLWGEALVLYMHDVSESPKTQNTNPRKQWRGRHVFGGGEEPVCASGLAFWFRR